MALGDVARDILFRYRGDFTDVERNAGGTADRLGQLADDLDERGRRWEKRGALMSATVTAPIVAAGAAMVSLASDQQEAFDKARAVFGDFAQDLIDWSDQAPKAFGLTRAEATDAAASIGNMALSSGLTQEAAALLGKDMVALAADMGALNNVNPNEMLTKLRSGLAGEAEPLRQYGVQLSAARIEAKAMELGLIGLGDELDAAAKIQAAAAIITEDSATAHGNFAETSDELAGSQRVLAAEVKQLAADLGEQLIPVAKDVLEWVSELVGWFRDLPPEVQEAAIKAAALAAAIGPLLVVGGRLLRLFGFIARHPVITAIVAIGAAFIWAYQNSETFRAVVDGVVSWLTDTAWPAIQWVVQHIRDDFAGLAHWWQNTGAPILTAAWGAVVAVVSTAGAIIRGVVDSIKWAFSSMVNWVRDKANAAIGLINKLIGGVNKIPGVNIPTLGMFQAQGFGTMSQPATTQVVFAGNVYGSGHLEDQIVQVVQAAGQRRRLSPAFTGARMVLP